MRADPAERPQVASLSNRKQRILALEELHAMGILDRDEFVAEMKSNTKSQATLDPTSPEVPTYRQRWGPFVHGLSVRAAIAGAAAAKKCSPGSAAGYLWNRGRRYAPRGGVA